MSKIKRDLRAKINKIKITDPLLGQKYDDALLQPNEFDEAPEEDVMELVKYYPGSQKGPRPEDDPKHYSEWFMRN